MTLLSTIQQAKITTAKILVDVRRIMLSLGLEPEPLSEDQKIEIEKLTGEKCP